MRSKNATTVLLTTLNRQYHLPDLAWTDLPQAHGPGFKVASQGVDHKRGHEFGSSHNGHERKGHVEEDPEDVVDPDCSWRHLRHQLVGPGSHEPANATDRR